MTTLQSRFFASALGLDAVEVHLEVDSAFEASDSSGAVVGTVVLQPSLSGLFLTLMVITFGSFSTTRT